MHVRDRVNWSTGGGEKRAEAALIQRALLLSRGAVRETQVNNRTVAVT